MHLPLFCFALRFGPLFSINLLTLKITKRYLGKTDFMKAKYGMKPLPVEREDSEIVAAFFKEHPLRKIFSICHNDCPVIKCRPVIAFPAIANTARSTGAISIHVLVNEEGKVLYARILAGHPLLWAAARRGACETQFNIYPDHKRQGVMHFTVDNSGYLGVPYGANQVP